MYLGVTFDQTLSYREHLSRSAAKLKFRNNLIVKLAGTYGVPAQAPSAHQPWLCATQNTAAQCGLDPATQISTTPNFRVQCTWFQATCNPHSCRGCQYSAVLHLLLYIIKRQLSVCFKSNHRSASKLAHVCSWFWASTSTACILTPSVVRLDICRHNYAVERGLVIGFCGQPHYCYWPYYSTARFRSPSSYIVSDEPLTCTNGVSPNHLPVIVASDKHCRHVNH